MVPYVIATAVLYVLDRLLRIIQDAGTLGRNARVRVKMASRVGGTGSVLQVRIPRRRWLDWFTRRAVRMRSREEGVGVQGKKALGLGWGQAGVSGYLGAYSGDAAWGGRDWVRISSR